MRTAPWLLTSMFALTLAGCGDDKSDDTTNPTTGTPATDPGTSTVEPTTAEPTTVDPTTGEPTPPTTVEPTTVEPTTVEPTTVEPTTVDPDTGGTSTTTGNPVELTCDNYCALYASGCDDFKAYDNTEECMAQCAQWPLGEAGATAGDSLGCRLYHVGVANQVDADIHCPHSGPNGALTCVDDGSPVCMTYCDTYFTNCTEKLNLYKDKADCMTQCAPWYQGKSGDTAGDSVGCREYHAGVAKGDPVLHCPHAGPGGAMVCVTP